MIKEAIPNLEAMSAAEKMLLLEELCEHLAEQPEEIPTPEWVKEELQRRLQDAIDHPEDQSPWHEVKARLERLV